MHWLYKPATLRDVLEARNYVVRVIIKFVYFVTILGGAAGGIWVSRIWDREGPLAAIIGGVVLGAALFWFSKSSFDDVERDVKESERQCQEARALKEQSEAAAQSEVDRLEALLNTRSELEGLASGDPELAATLKRVGDAAVRGQLDKAKEHLEAIRRL